MENGMKRLIAVVALALASCATPYALVEPGRTTAAGLSVEPGVRWNTMGILPWEGRVAVWTLDGPRLNHLLFIGGTQDGEAIFTRKADAAGTSTSEPPPVFRRTMNALEIAELFQATIARNYQTTLADVSDVTTAQFLGQPGFRFDTRFVGRDEIERDGTVIGTVKDGQLYAIWFSGARQHYYKRYLPEIERIAQSTRLTG
jgi:hypothetical protein